MTRSRIVALVIAWFAVVLVLSFRALTVGTDRVQSGRNSFNPSLTTARAEKEGLPDIQAPPFAHGAAVALSGVAEVLLGTLLLWRRSRRLAAWGIIAMLIAFLPVHLHMLMHSSLYPEVPVLFLWLRFPMQAVLVLWAYWYTLDIDRPARAE